MQGYKLHEINTNDVCDEIVFLDDSFAILYPHTPLSSHIKNILKKTNINVLFTNGSFLDKLEETKEDAIKTKYIEDIKLYKRARKLYQSFYNEFNSIYEHTPDKYIVEYERLNNLIYNKIYPEVRKKPHYYLVTDDLDNTHSTNSYTYYLLKNLVFALAALEAMPSNTIKGSNQKIQIAIANSLMDIGVLPIVKQLKTEGESTNINIRNTKVMPVIHKMTNKILDRSFLPPAIIDMINQIHFYYTNNSDSNNTLKSTNTDNIMQIKMAQTGFILMWYVHLTTSLPDHKAVNPTTAIQTLIKNTGKLFDKESIKSLVNTMGYIPPGTYVELENKSIAFVYKTDLTYIKNPLVILLKGPKGENKNELSMISTIPTELTITRIIYEKKDIAELKEIKKKILN